MGFDNTRYPPLPAENEPHPGLALTIGEIAARRWKLRAVCGHCGIAYGCDPDQIAARIGAGVFFWGRRGKCRAYIGPNMCWGRVRFEARTARGEAWWPLAGDVERRARHLWRLRQLKAATCSPGQGSGGRAGPPPHCRASLRA